MDASHDDNHWMQRALSCALKAQAQGEVPVGAVLVYQGELIAEGYNQPIAQHDPSSHAEINVLRQAGQVLQNYRLPNTTLYVTLEPCMMCAGCILHARVGRLVYGASDPKTGAINSVHQLLSHSKNNHQVEVVKGVCEQQASSLLKSFFKQKRESRVQYDHS